MWNKRAALHLKDGDVIILLALDALDCLDHRQPGDRLRNKHLFKKIQ